MAGRSLATKFSPRFMLGGLSCTTISLPVLKVVPRFIRGLHARLHGHRGSHSQMLRNILDVTSASGGEFLLGVT